MSATSPWSREVVRHLSLLGAQVHVVDFKPEGGRRGYIDYAPKNDVAMPDDLEQYTASIDCVPTPGSLPQRFVFSARWLRRVAREYNADLVLTLYGGSLAAAAYLSGFRPYIVYVVGSDVLLATTLQKLIARVTLTKSSVVLANGQHLAEATARLAPSAKVEPLYLGVDVGAYSPTRGERNHYAMVCTRGFLELYDNATIVRALGALEQVPVDFTMSFLSSGPLLPEAQRLADDLISPLWRDRVIFLGGTKHEELRTIIKSASFYLSASLSDGTSSSLLEAMASGLIPIVSDIPANREWITDGKNGLLFAPGDHNGLAEAIRRALRNEGWMENARMTNRKLVEERANADMTMQKLLEIITMHSKPGGKGTRPT
ncbi:MAG TPA: glycosyltransferase family 4 protein [Gemmatimonadaceae bacterium]|nr:glycosyltransferase family 4 protein [Gemmatimonadaceae bacterium]